MIHHSPLPDVEIPDTSLPDFGIEMQDAGLPPDAGVEFNAVTCKACPDCSQAEIAMFCQCASRRSWRSSESRTMLRWVTTG